MSLRFGVVSLYLNSQISLQIEFSSQKHFWKFELFDYDRVIDLGKTKAITVRIDSLIYYHLGKLIW